MTKEVLYPHCFRKSITVSGREITADVTVLNRGINIGIYGGDRPHIGAVCTVTPEKEVLLTEFPGHREGIVAQMWADALSNAGWHPVVISAGIHYDRIDRAGIQAVVSSAKDLLAYVLEELSRVTPNTDETVASTPG